MNRTMGKSSSTVMQKGKTGLGTRIMPGAGTFRLKDGRQVQVVKGSGGSRLFLLQGRGKRPAPDGAYTQQNGQIMIVRGGSLVGHGQLPQPHPLGNPDRTQTPGLNSMQAPGSQQQLGGENGPLEGMRTR